MISIEKLCGKNIDNFKSLVDEANRYVSYRLDFFASHDDKSFLSKHILRKNVNLIIHNGTYIGYAWIRISSNKVIYIQDIFVKKEYLGYISEGFPLLFRGNTFIYESLENDYFKALASALGMYKIRESYLMSLDTRYPLENIKYNLQYRPLILNKDEELRCLLQNSIFKDNSRVPLTPSDVRFDEKQEYYLKDLCIFLLCENKAIGYGQIVFNRGIYSIVNFGILEKYRGKGYGKEFMHRLIILAKEHNIEELNIRVDALNEIAKKLYYNVGFEEKGIFSTWIYNKNKV